MNQQSPLFIIEERNILGEAKQAIVAAFERFQAENPGKLKNQLEHEFCDRYNKGFLEFIGLTEWVKDYVKSLSRSTLKRIFKALKDGTQALATTFKRQGLIDNNPELREAMLALIAEYGYKTPRHFRILLQATPNYSKLPLPSEYQIRSWIKRFKANNRKKAAKLKSEKEYKNSYMPAFGSYSSNLTRPNELWELDSSPTDIYLSYQDHDGAFKRKRFALIACIDVFTRRTKIRVAETSNSEAIALLIRDCILDWGVPDTLKMDNGKDYASKLIQRFCAALEIDIKHCQPFHPWQKPHIERFFRTFQHGELELLPGYVGHNLSERDHLRESGRLNEKAFGVDMSLSAFQDWTNKWCEKYHYQHHKGLKLAPVEKLKEAVDQGWKKRTIADGRVRTGLEKLDLLLLPSAERKAGKSGISFQNKTYIHEKLDCVSTAYFRYNPDDVNTIYVFSDADYTRFLCEANWVNSISPEKQAEIGQKVKAIAKHQDNVGKANRKAAANNRKRKPVDFLTDEETINVSVPEELHDSESLISLDVCGKSWQHKTQEERDRELAQEYKEYQEQEAYYQANPTEHPEYKEQQRLKKIEQERIAKEAAIEAEKIRKEEELKQEEENRTRQGVLTLKELLTYKIGGNLDRYKQYPENHPNSNLAGTWVPASFWESRIENFWTRYQNAEIWTTAVAELEAEGITEKGQIPPHSSQKQPCAVA